MKTRTYFIAWALAAMLSPFASNAAERSASTGDDQVIASFERELHHEAPQPKAAAGDDVGDDVLYERIAKPLQSPEAGEAKAKEAQS